MILGLLPARGGSLADLAATGQLARVVDYDLKAYADAFDEVRYFTYGDARDDAWALYPLLGHRLRVLSIRDHALARSCDVLRVMNFTGVVPALVAHWCWGIPFVLQYGFDHELIAALHGRIVKVRLLRWLRKIAMPRAAAVIVPNEYLAERARRSGARRVEVIPNGVDTAKFCPAGRFARRVVTVGRRAPEKNLEVVEQAAQRLGVEWVHVDRAPYDLMPKILQEGGVYCLPSLTEGSSKSLIEAMSCGLPCVVSTGVPEVDGAMWSVWLADPYDVDAWVRAISDALGWEPSFTWAGRDFVVKHRDIHALLAREVAVTRDVAEGRSGSRSRGEGSTARRESPSRPTVGGSA